MLKYNLCYIKQENKVLLLNRNKSGWMGCWNGVGGKLEPHEAPRVSMLREIVEETGLTDLKVDFKGFITWSRAETKTGLGGLYLYTADLLGECPYNTPFKTDEGILDWKEIDWILHPDNLGVAYSLPLSMQMAFQYEKCFDHHSIFDGNQLIEQISTEIDPRLENDLPAREKYLRKYFNQSA